MKQALNNSIITISPYKVNNSFWAFDDARTGLIQEAFVLGASEAIDMMLEAKGIKTKKCNLAFSVNPIPQYDLKIELLSEESDEFGSWYQWPERNNFRLWLCSALFCYFPKAPKILYAKII